jgi:hypothetical protein
VSVTAEKFNARVVWGPRAESAEECADRWRTTIRALAGLDPMLAGWIMYDDDDDDDPANWRPVPLGDADLLPIVRAGAGDAGAGLGFNFGTVNDQDDEHALFFHASAGMSAPIEGLLNVARLEIRPTSPAGLRRWAELAEPVLAVLVEAWAPDHGHVYTFPQHQAQWPAPRQPLAGSVTYLCAHRSQLVPADLAASGRPTPDGGLLLSLVRDGELPPDETVVALGTRLREAGAFEPIPVDRATW